MSERPAEQTRTATARPPLAERLQQKLSSAVDERRAAASAPSDASPVLPPPPAELQRKQEQEQSSPTTSTPVVPAKRAATTTRRTTRAAKAPRRARLRLTRIDPWSVMKVSFLLSIAFGIVTVVSVMMIWSVLGAAGVWDSINQTVADMVSSGNNTSTFDVTNYLGTSRVMGFTMLVSVIDVVLITAVATLGAFLYNMAAALLGGIEVTLAEDRS